MLKIEFALERLNVHVEYLSWALKRGSNVLPSSKLSKLWKRKQNPFSIHTTSVSLEQFLSHKTSLSIYGVNLITLEHSN
jgi:hypothetical protein